MLVDLGLQKSDRLPHFLHTIQPILDRDPRGESNRIQCGKNLVIVVEPLPDDPVRKAAGLTDGVLLLSEVFESTALEIAVTCVH